MKISSNYVCVEYDVHVSNVNDKNTSSEKYEISSFHENGMKTPIENLFYSTHISTIKSLKNRQPSSEKKNHECLYLLANQVTHSATEVAEKARTLEY